MRQIVYGRFQQVKRDFDEILQQRRGMESFEKRICEEDERVVTLEQIKIITELLEKAPRSTVINFGATEELVAVIEKASVIMNQMHEMAFGKNQRQDKLEEMLLKVFRDINAKVKGISERLDRFEDLKTGAGRKEPRKLINLPEKSVQEKPEVTEGAGEKHHEEKKALESPPPFEDEEGKVVIKGYTFEDIPYTVSDKGVAAFAWKKANDQEEALKKALIQLHRQGVDTSNTFALKEAGFETIYTKFRNLNLANKNWRQWITSWHQGVQV